MKTNPIQRDSSTQRVPGHHHQNETQREKPSPHVAADHRPSRVVPGCSGVDRGAVVEHFYVCATGFHLRKRKIPWRERDTTSGQLDGAALHLQLREVGRASWF